MVSLKKIQCVTDEEMSDNEVLNFGLGYIANKEGYKLSPNLLKRFSEAVSHYKFGDDDEK